MGLPGLQFMKDHLKDLKRNQEQLLANLNATNGAIQTAEHFIKQMEEELLHLGKEALQALGLMEKDPVPEPAPVETPVENVQVPVQEPTEEVHAEIPPTVPEPTTSTA